MYFCSQIHKQLKCLSEVEVLLGVCLGWVSLAFCAEQKMESLTQACTSCSLYELCISNSDAGPVQVARSSTGPLGPQSTFLLGKGLPWTWLSPDSVPAFDSLTDLQYQGKLK